MGGARGEKDDESTYAEASMKKRTMLWMLAALNAVLATALVFKLGGEPTAQAQARARGDYVMVPGLVNGVSNGVVYVVDTRNGLLSAFTFDHNTKEMQAMPPIDLNRVLGAGGRR